MKCEHGNTIRVLYWPTDRTHKTYDDGVELQVVGCNLCDDLFFYDLDEVDPERRRQWGPILQDNEIPEEPWE